MPLVQTISEITGTAFTITPNDSVDLSPRAVVAVYIGGSGNMSVVTANGSSVIFTGLVAGSVLNVPIKRVLSTGTTATNLIGLY